MSRRTDVVSRAILGLVCFCTPVLAQNPAGNQDLQTPDEVFRIGVNVVTVRFSVRDPQGRFVNNVPLDRITIVEEGLEKDVVYFEPPESRTPDQSQLWLAFLIDVSGSTFSTRTEQIYAARTFFDNLQDFTRVGIFGFTDKLLDFQDFTSNRSLVLEAFSQARRQLGRTAIYDSLQGLIQRMKTNGGEDDRRVVIVISDARDKRHTLSAQTIYLARVNGVRLYTIHVPSAAQLYIRPGMAADDTQAAKQEENRKMERAFARLSQQTGGKHFSGFGAILSFDETLAQITEDVLGNLYTVAYPTSDSDIPSQDRDLQILVRGGDLRASRAFKSLPDQLKSKKSFISALLGDNSQFNNLDLSEQYREIGADLDILRAKKEGGRFGQPIRLKISPLTLSGDRSGVRTQIGVVGQLMDRDGNEVVRLREVFSVILSRKEMARGGGVIYNNKLIAPEGIYNLRLAVVDISNWRMTAFEREVRIVERRDR